MTFIFFNASDQVLFLRDDAERAEHNHQEMSLYALFPFDPAKEITAGMRVGYTDNLGVFQVFEIIKPKNYEPDHYQEITAEHIAIAELTDEMYTAGDILNKTPQQALTAILAGTQWSVGTVTATNTSSAQFSVGYVWDDVRSIETSWNVYITPRITVSASGITGRYLDIAPAQATWRGLRFSLEKNLDDASVTWDTSRLKTALYGYGKSQEGGDPLTFASVTWTATSSHPAKPKNQIYLEDPTATAAYGRDGRPRFGYYQNGDVDDPTKLLELTWEALKSCNAPDVTIDGQVRDLTKFGEVDVPIRLHDSAQIEITPTGTLLVNEVRQYTEDLLQPENSRATIGKYIPNIVFITKEIANGRGGRGGSGNSDTDEEYKIKEFETSIGWNDYQISLKAWQRDLDHTDENLLLAFAAIGISSNQISSIVTGSGVQLDAHGNIVTDANGYPVFKAGYTQMWSNVQQNAEEISTLVTKTGIDSLGTGQTLYSRITQNASSITTVVSKTGINNLSSGQTLYSRIQQNADAISLKVSNGDVATELAVECGNVSITGGNLVVSGYVTAAAFEAEQARFDNLVTGTTVASYLRGYTGRFDTLQGLFGGYYYSLKQGSMNVCTGVGSSGVIMIGSSTNVSLDHYHNISASVTTAGVVTITMGKARSTAASANFNIADTAFYKSGVSASYNNGYRNAANAMRWPTTGGSGSTITITYPNTSNSTSKRSYIMKATDSWSSRTASKTVYLYQDRESSSNIVGQVSVAMPASGTWLVEAANGNHYGLQVKATFKAGGKTYTYNGEI